MLKQFLTVDGGEAAMNALQAQLCGLPDDLLQEAERLFLTQLDFRKLFTVTGTACLTPLGLLLCVCVCLMVVCVCFLSERASDGQR